MGCEIDPNFWVDSKKYTIGNEGIPKNTPNDIFYQKYIELELKYNKLKENLLEMTNMYLELKRSKNV